MGMIEKWMTSFLAWLSGLFGVSTDHLHKDRRGNLPPPEGGPGA
jgi:hypothetical protein